MARNLTDKQQMFLNVLFDGAGGDVVLAKNRRKRLARILRLFELAKK